MEEYHHKNGQCEQCGLSIDEVGSLQPLNFWMVKNERRHPYYLYVCDSCFDSREKWCTHIYPDNCDNCNAVIEDGDHFLEKKVNENNENIHSFGLMPNETCRVLCHECHSTKTAA